MLDGLARAEYDQRRRAERNQYSRFQMLSLLLTRLGAPASADTVAGTGAAPDGGSNPLQIRTVGVHGENVESKRQIQLVTEDDDLLAVR